MTSDTCPFCKIASGETQTQILHRDGEVLAFRDIRPVAPVHILVIPTRHIAAVSELEPADAEILTAMFNVARGIAESEGLRKGGYRLVINTGPDAGQSVFHLHMHLLAGRRMLWPPG